MILAVAAACTAPPEPTMPEPTIPEVDVSDIVAVFDGLAAAEAYHFEVAREGPPFPLDVLPGLGASQLEGTFVAPDSLAGSVTGSIGPIALTVPMIQIADRIWVENPLAGRWEEFSTAELVDVAGLVATDGVPELVLDDLTDLERGTDGTLTGTLDTGRISERSGGVVGAGNTTATVVATDGSIGIRFVDPVEPEATWVVVIGPETTPIVVSEP